MKNSGFSILSKSICCLFMIAGLSACKKNNTGGMASVTAEVFNNGRPINYPTVYVHFGESNPPQNPTENYDLKLVGKHDNHVHVLGLRYGTYYMYSVATDSLLQKSVSGGVAVNIPWSERKKEMEISIPVKE
jgi:hypothetical protein